MPKTLLVFYFSGTGKTGKMASNIAEGAEKEGIKVILKKGEDCILNDHSPNINRKARR